MSNVTPPMAEIDRIEQKLRAGLDKASAGKWQVGHNWVFIDPIDPERNPSHALRNIMRDVPEDELQANVDHIVAAQPDNIRLLLDELYRLRGREEELRKALIACGRNVGAWLADEVSSEFLMLVPEEVRLVVERLKASAPATPSGVKSHE